MEIIEVSREDFINTVASPYHIFGSAQFTFLNKDKAEDTFYFLFRDGKYRLGLTCGIRQNMLLSPFSAPFGGFVFLDEDIKINYIDAALTSLINWTENKKLECIRIVLPPTFYHESFISKQVNSLFRLGFLIDTIDLNYSFKTKSLTADYINQIWRNARKNLNIALKNNLSFGLCTNLADKEKAYEVIKINRESRGFPLRMSWNQVRDTIELIEADFFLCTDDSNNSIASAVVFHVARNIVQVVYWGDIPQYSHLKTMNFLAYKVFEHYQTIGIDIIDIGPSTENSLPNYGLCEFKESIGCDITQKFIFKKQIL